MATTINVYRKHSLGLEEAKERGQKLVARFHEKLSGLISEVTWSADGTEGTAGGKLFTAVFHIMEDAVNVDVELRGLGARVMKGQIKAQVEKSVERRFCS